MRPRAAPQYLDTLFLGALVVLLAVSLGLFGYVVLLRGEMPSTYTDVGNAVQLVASATAAGAAAWSYFRRGPDLLLAHGAFAGATWTLANAFWYAYFILIGEGLNYPTVADLGFAGVFLFLIAGFQEGLPRNRLPLWAAAPIVLPLLGAGLWLVAVLGADAKTLTTLVIFVLSAALLTSALLRSVHRHPVLLTATAVFVLAHLCNSLNSTLPDPPWVVKAAGALAAIAFSLYAIAFLTVLEGGGTVILEFYLAASLPLFFLLIFLEGGQRRVLAFLAWGLTAAVISYYVNYNLYLAFASTSVIPEVTMAPIVEEFMKALPLFVLLLVFGRRYSKELLVLAMASGFGFAILENYVFVSHFALEGPGAIVYAVTRGITTSVMHGCMTAIIGYGIFLTYGFSRRSLPSILFGLYTIAVMLHALYNLLIGHTGFGRLLAIDLPLLLFVLLLVAYNWDVLFPKPAEEPE